MIIKTREGFKSSDLEPIAIILSETEKKAIANMPENNLMIAFYPVNGGFSPELITEWMKEGIQFQQQVSPKTAKAVKSPTDKPAFDAEYTIVEAPKHD